MILATMVGFGSWRKIWSNTVPSKYIPAPFFCKKGIVRDRFDNLWKHIRFSDQKDTRPGGM